MPRVLFAAAGLSAILPAQSWSEVSPTANGASYAALAFDEARGQMVRFGGIGDHFIYTLREDTWVNDGGHWQQLQIPSGLPLGGVYGVGMVYDPTARRLFSYGGYSAGGYLFDTRVFDGSSWLTLQSGGGPSYVVFALGYDRARGRPVLSVARGSQRETWEWIGTNWQQVTANDPAFVSCMAFDPVRGRLVGLAGRDLYEWIGTSWSMVVSRLLPSLPYSELGFAYDEARGRLVIVDAHVAGAPVWEWDGVALSAFTPTLGPRPRVGQGMAYDPVRRRVVLTGGEEGHYGMNDTWEWDGIAWTERCAGPLPLESPCMAVDTTRNRTVLFGGMLANHMPSFETWEWDGLQWQRRNPPTVPVTLAIGMAFDSGRSRAVMVGLNANTMATDTWEWDGLNWALRTTASAPPLRRLSAVAFDQARGELVLFGGIASGANPALGDTWLFNGVTWRQAVPSTSPPSRYGHAMAYDPLRQRTVLFGGGDQTILYADTWEWDGSTWQQVPTSYPAPSWRMGHAMAFDPVSGRVVMSGGAQSSPLPFELWSWDGSRWQQRPSYMSPVMDHAMTATSRGLLLQGGYVQDTPAAGVHLQQQTRSTQIAARLSGGLVSWGCTGSLGVPVLTSEWTPRLGASDYAMRLCNVLPAAPSVLGLATRFGPQPIGNGCAIWLAQPQFVTALAGATGCARFALPVPANPALVGVSLYCQAGALDAGSPLGNGFASSSWVVLGLGY